MSEADKPIQGRPIKYDPSMCDVVLKLAESGASKVEMVVELGIARSTFYKWQEDFPEFGEAVKVATDISQAWWERMGRTAVFGGVDSFNASSYIFTMKNRFRNDYADSLALKNETPEDKLKIETETTLKESDRELIKRFLPEMIEKFKD